MFEPGCKFDTVLTLMGSQGIGKSRLIASMGKRWFSNTFGRLDNNGAMENIQGVWIMEIGEMAGLKMAEQNAVKDFISKTFDRFRVAYGKRVEEFQRQCIFIASTNEEFPLHDQTGGRRFWLVKLTKNMNYNLSEEEIDQLWAEAVHYYRSGETVYLDEHVEKKAKEIQSLHTETDDRAARIEGYVNMMVPLTWPSMSDFERLQFMNGEDDDKTQELVSMDRVSVDDIWTDVFRGNIKDMTPFATRFIRHTMNKMPGWQPKLYTFKSKTYRGWENISVKMTTKV